MDAAPCRVDVGISKIRVTTCRTESQSEGGSSMTNRAGMTAVSAMRTPGAIGDAADYNFHRPGAKGPVEFALGACRAAVQLERGRSGLRATTFCTSWNVALGPARASDTGARGADLAKPVHRPIQGGGHGVSRSPSLSPLFR